MREILVTENNDRYSTFENASIYFSQDASHVEILFTEDGLKKTVIIPWNRIHRIVISN